MYTVGILHCLGENNNKKSQCRQYFVQLVESTDSTTDTKAKCSHLPSLGLWRQTNSCDNLHVSKNKAFTIQLVAGILLTSVLYYNRVFKAKNLKED